MGNSLSDQKLSDPVLVTGASGVLGWHLCRFLRDTKVPVTGTFAVNRPALRGCAFVQMELTDPDTIRAALRSGQFRAIVHAAAMTNPDECAEQPQKARTVNVDATRLLVKESTPDIPFVYISTDLVFDGKKGHYVEEDPAHPGTFYGKTKLEAEGFVRSRENGLVLRIAKLYANGSPYHPCFITWISERLQAGQNVPLFMDQYRSHLYVGDALRAIQKVLQHLSTPAHTLYHVGGPERATRYEFGKLYCEVFGRDLNRIEAISSSDLELVSRGVDCSLISSRFGSEFDFVPLSMSLGLQRLKQDLY